SAQLHRARLRARAGARPHPQVGRQGAGARARGEGLRLGDRRHHGRRGSGGVTTPVAASTAAESYVAAFDELTAGGDGGGDAPAPLLALRRAAFERFATLGFPTTKNEDWHFTSASPIADQEFVLLASRSGDVRREELEPFEFGVG